MKGGYSVFKGPLKDNKGAEVVPAGKALPETAIELESCNYLSREWLARSHEQPPASRAPLGARLRAQATPTAGIRSPVDRPRQCLRRWLALIGAAVLFSVFLLFQGASPLDFLDLVWRGAFGSWFSIQNTVQRASPLLLTALCVLVAGAAWAGGDRRRGGGRAGRTGRHRRGVAVDQHQPVIVWAAMAVAGVRDGRVLDRHQRLAARQAQCQRDDCQPGAGLHVGLALFNHFVEGVLRDPASLNKPSTYGIGDDNMLDTVPWLDVHPGLPVGILACVLCLGADLPDQHWLCLPRHRRQHPRGSVAGIAGQQADPSGVRAGRRLRWSGRGDRGRGGIWQRANASLNAGYGYTGILIAFLARFNPLAIMPMAILLGGLGAAGGLLQRRMGLPDATIQVLQGLIFVSILASDTLYGRFRWFQPRGTA